MVSGEGSRRPSSPSALAVSAALTVFSASSYAAIALKDTSADTVPFAEDCLG